MTDDREQMTGDREQMTEDRGQGADVSWHQLDCSPVSSEIYFDIKNSEDSDISSVFCFLSSVI